MTKNTLRIFIAATALIILGAGCSSQFSARKSALNTESTATFTIKELGITLQIPAIYKDDLAYEIKPATQNGRTVYMFSRSIMEKDATCGPGSIGFIVQSKQLYTTEGSDTRKPVPGHDIKIDDAYITIDGPQDLCTKDKELQGALNDRIEALRAAVSTILPVEGTESF
ncbi:MAG: hypothetical protein ACD_76C00044G0021 [uncultured bacterium]|nr:MAG: hypothetical protein ACD_76C00044G0021 [uncultured bacterium]HBD05196.1 hypothetical protein [Candidatus Uhrbacteria bacterium]